MRGMFRDYYKLVGRPGGELQVKDDNDKNDQKFCDIDEYVEVKALMGGTTSITGVSGRSQPPPVPSCVLGLARNLDWASGFYGRGAGSERIENALGVTPGDLHEDVLERISVELSNNKIDLLLVHVAEGAPEDLESTVEFRALKGAGLLGSHTAIIHGVALGPDQSKEMASRGTALVWSPRSNFELYGFTADIASAKKANVAIALAPDWSPTGSSGHEYRRAGGSDLGRNRWSGREAGRPRRVFRNGRCIDVPEVEQKPVSEGTGNRLSAFGEDLRKRRIGGLAGQQVHEGFLLIPETRRSHAGRSPFACRVLEAYSFRRRAYLLCVHRVHGSRFAIGHPRG
jgi:hypothetical protein